MKCSACAHNLHIYHKYAVETEVCVCDFCTMVSQDAKDFVAELASRE